MIIDFKKIIEINTINDLQKFKINEPIFHNNYLFHYLIIFNKLDTLKLIKFPIYEENNEGLNGIFLAAKYNNFEILKYLLNTYTKYIYNTNNNNERFVNYLNPKDIIKLLNLNLDWNLLLENKINVLLFNLNYENLMILFKKIKLENYSLNMIILNNHLKIDQILQILDMYPNNLNLRYYDDTTIIFPAIHKKNITLIKYILNKNIDIDYYTILNTYHPLKTAININFMDAADLIWNKIKKTFNYDSTNLNLENIAHFLLKRNSTDKLSLEILKNCPSSVWASKDINKITPLELLCKYDFKYNYLIKNKKVIINFKIKNNQWKHFLEDFPLYYDSCNISNYENTRCLPTNIKLNEYLYSHSNLFQSKFKDMSFYLLYLINKYKKLYYPKINDIQLNNLTNISEMNMEWPDTLLENNYIFPWIICYENENEYWIHPMLNNLINAQINKKKYHFGFCYLSLRLEDGGLHANILIYDFINLTLERFDPYGNTVNFDKKLDEILEEELTWNTKLKYLNPSDYMPVTGFQTVSDELNPYKQKYGDFGGYCLAWCIWYLEHRIINHKIKSKELVLKLIKKLSENKNTFMEYIRNYANNLNKGRIKYLNKAGIDPKIISNANLTFDIENKLDSYIIDKFNKN